MMRVMRICQVRREMAAQPRQFGSLASSGCRLRPSNIGLTVFSIT